MKGLTRLIISDNRIENLQNKKFKLSYKEAHYVNKVMRLRMGDQISIVNGKGSLWKGIKKDNNFIEIEEIDKPSLFQEKKKFLLGIAISIPKNGFEDILKMSTEIGIDFIQPLYSDHQIKNFVNTKTKMTRWNAIINEAVEQCERLWKPELLDILDLYEWVKLAKEKYILSTSVTRNQNCMYLQEWLKRQTFLINQSSVLWNIIGPEGGWSEKELLFFEENKIQFIKLSDSIMRTSTAAINASSILNQWRSYDTKSFYKK